MTSLEAIMELDSPLSSTSSLTELSACSGMQESETSDADLSALAKEAIVQAINEHGPKHRRGELASSVAFTHAMELIGSTSEAYNLAHPAPVSPIQQDINEDKPDFGDTDAAIGFKWDDDSYLATNTPTESLSISVQHRSDNGKVLQFVFYIRLLDLPSVRGSKTLRFQREEDAVPAHKLLSRPDIRKRFLCALLHKIVAYTQAIDGAGNTINLADWLCPRPTDSSYERRTDQIFGQAIEEVGIDTAGLRERPHPVSTRIQRGVLRWTGYHGGRVFTMPRDTDICTLLDVPPIDHYDNIVWSTTGGVHHVQSTLEDPTSRRAAAILLAWIYAEDHHAFFSQHIARAVTTEWVAEESDDGDYIVRNSTNTTIARSKIRFDTRRAANAVRDWMAQSSLEQFDQNVIQILKWELEASLASPQTFWNDYELHWGVKVFRRVAMETECKTVGARCDSVSGKHLCRRCLKIHGCLQMLRQFCVPCACEHWVRRRAISLDDRASAEKRAEGLAQMDAEKIPVGCQVPRLAPSTVWDVLKHRRQQSAQWAFVERFTRHPHQLDEDVESLRTVIQSGSVEGTTYREDGELLHFHTFSLTTSLLQQPLTPADRLFVVCQFNNAMAPSVDLRLHEQRWEGADSSGVRAQRHSFADGRYLQALPLVFNIWKSVYSTPILLLYACATLIYHDSTADEDTIDDAINLLTRLTLACHRMYPATALRRPPPGADETESADVPDEYIFDTLLDPFPVGSESCRQLLISQLATSAAAIDLEAEMQKATSATPAIDEPEASEANILSAQEYLNDLKLLYPSAPAQLPFFVQTTSAHHLERVADGARHRAQLLCDRLTQAVAVEDIDAPSGDIEWTHGQADTPPEDLDQLESGPDLQGTAADILALWAWDRRHGQPRDLITGMIGRMATTSYDPIGLSLCSHRTHGMPFKWNCVRSSDVDGVDEMNARSYELASSNMTMRSFPGPALEAVFQVQKQALDDALGRIILTLQDVLNVRPIVDARAALSPSTFRFRHRTRTELAITNAFSPDVPYSVEA